MFLCPTRRRIALGAVLAMTTGCGGLSGMIGAGDPVGYARGLPVACEGKLAEIDDLGGDVTAIRVARTVKTGAIALVPLAVGLGLINPIAALAPPALAAFRLDDAGRQKRIDFLIERYYEQDCAPL